MEKHRDIQSDRQSDRNTDRQTQRHTVRQTVGQTDRQETDTYRQADKKGQIHTDRQTDTDPKMQKDRETQTSTELKKVVKQRHPKKTEMVNIDQELHIKRTSTRNMTSSRLRENGTRISEKRRDLLRIREDLTLKMDKQRDESFDKRKQTGGSKLRDNKENMNHNNKEDNNINISDLQWEFINKCILKRQPDVNQTDKDHITRDISKEDNVHYTSDCEDDQQSAKDVSQSMNPNSVLSRMIPDAVTRSDIMREESRESDKINGDSANEQESRKHKGEIKSKALKRLLIAQKARAKGIKNIWISQKKVTKGWTRSSTGMLQVT
ncbi:hypothetical protein LSH36_8g06009 [Paralvinella palmiformis]|uniref:Uncharacterized protein n=1 Tax=Paralvinella palmiformis TaxID=53620 RepID=A0AAD9NGX2_9ANNE|nr:hypothetical protein LSH36_8g06009 [Paralvinella palmiformis]